MPTYQEILNNLYAEVIGQNIEQPNNKFALVLARTGIREHHNLLKNKLKNKIKNKNY